MAWVRATHFDQATRRFDPKDYEFLEKFLDITKSNLFFAKGGDHRRR